MSESLLKIYFRRIFLERNLSMKYYKDILQIRLIGYTKPVDMIGIDDVQDLIAYCAKVSNPQFQTDFSKSERLLTYLKTHSHWSPFEMASATMEVTTTRDIARQFLRHRSFSFQEFCIAGNTEIYFDLPKAVEQGKRRLYKKTIKDLYTSWHDSAHKKTSIQKMFVRQLDLTTGLLTHSNIKNIFYTGVKSLFKITLDNGKSITCTKEHKLYSKTGFDTLERLVGLSINNTKVSMNKACEIACNGEPIYRNKEWLQAAKQRSIENKTGVTGIAAEADISYNTIRKWLRIHNLQFTKKEVASYIEIWNKGKFGYKNKPHTEETREKMRNSARKGPDSNLWKGGVDRSFRLQVTDYIAKYRDFLFKQANYSCSRCNSNKKLELHHIVPVYENKNLAFDISNIEVICKQCHTKHHKINSDYSVNKKARKLTVNYSKIINIEYAGEEDTYDLEVESNSHNYVANGIITHNSQRYANPQDMETAFVLREARLQDTKNRQNSIKLDKDSDGHAVLEDAWKNKQEQLIKLAKETYDWALANSIAKEQARVVLPEGNTISKVYVNGTIRSWIHYAELRSANGTQKEHQMLAIACAEAISKIFPMIK